jgi:4-aminobutyrate aminotransferase
MQEAGFGDHVTAMGAYLKESLAALSEKHELIGDVRVVGLMIGIELVRDRATLEPANQERNAILNEAFRNGLTLLPAGESVIRFCPPLTIGKEDIDCGIRILDQAFRRVTA